jgi:hypothetical protein
MNHSIRLVKVLVGKSTLKEMCPEESDLIYFWRGGGAETSGNIIPNWKPTSWPSCWDLYESKMLIHIIKHSFQTVELVLGIGNFQLNE